PSKFLQAILMAGLLVLPAAQAQVLVYDEHWPFNAVPQTVAEQAMGPQSGNALAIVNNRPFIYETKVFDDDVSLFDNFFNGEILKIAEFRDPATNSRLAELLLLKSLSVAQSRHNQDPWDLVGCHANLGMLYYQKADYRKSESHWLRAAQLAQGLAG